MKIDPWSRFWFCLSLIYLVAGMYLGSKWWLLVAWLYLWLGAIIQDRANGRNP